MSVVKKVGHTFYVKVDTDYDQFAVEGTFKAFYINESSSTAVNIAGPFVEIIKTITTPNTGETSSISNAGTKSISVKDGSTLKIGDVIFDGTNYHYIMNVDSTPGSGKIIVKRSLLVNIPADTTLTEVGNTGLYKCPLSIPTVGEYTIIVNNPNINMQNTTSAVEIVSLDLNDINDRLDEISSNTDENFRKYKAFV